MREAMLAIGDSAIQLLAPLRADSPIGKFLDRNGEGIQQVAFRVDRRRRRVGRGCATPGSGCSTTRPRRGTAGSRINFVHPKDCGGVLVELVEPGPDPHRPV